MRHKKLSTLLTKQTKDPDKLEDEMRNSNIPDVLKNVVEEMMEATEMRRNDYQNAAWPYRQAHENGRYEALKQIRDILTIEN